MSKKLFGEKSLKVEIPPIYEKKIPEKILENPNFLLYLFLIVKKWF
jgi:hypothetical protein